jgi:hypothetical protein
MESSSKFVKVKMDLEGDRSMISMILAVNSLYDKKYEENFKRVVRMA